MDVSTGGAVGSQNVEVLLLVTLSSYVLTGIMYAKAEGQVKIIGPIEYHWDAVACNTEILARRSCAICRPKFY